MKAPHRPQPMISNTGAQVTRPNIWLWLAIGTVMLVVIGSLTIIFG